MEFPAPDKARPAAGNWALAAISLAILVAYGAIWTRGVQGDDLCMCGACSAMDIGMRFTLAEQLERRLFLALTQIGTYHLPWFSDPLRAPWYLIHATVVLAPVTFCGLPFQSLGAGRNHERVSTDRDPDIRDTSHHFGASTLAGESYGYVFGNLLTLLSVWAYLEL